MIITNKIQSCGPEGGEERWRKSSREGKGGDRNQTVPNTHNRGSKLPHPRSPGTRGQGCRLREGGGARPAPPPAAWEPRCNFVQCLPPAYPLLATKRRDREHCQNNDEIPNGTQNYPKPPAHSVYSHSLNAKKYKCKYKG